MRYNLSILNNLNYQTLTDENIRRTTSFNQNTLHCTFYLLYLWHMENGFGRYVTILYTLYIKIVTNINIVYKIRCTLQS